jgi:hypothetical protein
MRQQFRVRLLLVTAILATAGGVEGAPLNPARVGWSRVGLEAHKLFIKATTVAEWSVENAGSVAGRLAESPEGVVVVPGANILKVNYRAALPGLKSDTTLWMDPETGNSLQYEVRDSGKRFRERIVRYTDAGAYQRTRRPKPGEDKGTPAKWTDETAGFWPYGQNLAGQPVLDSLGLLNFIAASDLAKSGDQTEVLVFHRRALVRVRLTVDGLLDAKVAYRAVGDDGRRSCKGTTRALNIRLTVLPFGTESTDFDFLGLKSDIAIYLEPQSRLPLRIEGRAAVIGRVITNLQEARLKGNVRCPGLPGT